MKFTKYDTIAKVYFKNLYVQMSRLPELGGCSDVGKHGWYIEVLVLKWSCL